MRAGIALMRRGGDCVLAGALWSRVDDVDGGLARRVQRACEGVRIAVDLDAQSLLIRDRVAAGVAGVALSNGSGEGMDWLIETGSRRDGAGTSVRRVVLGSLAGDQNSETAGKAACLLLDALDAHRDITFVDGLIACVSERGGRAIPIELLEAEGVGMLGLRAGIGRMPLGADSCDRVAMLANVPGLTGACWRFFERLVMSEDAGIREAAAGSGELLGAGVRVDVTIDRDRLNAVCDVLGTVDGRAAEGGRRWLASACGEDAGRWLGVGARLLGAREHSWRVWMVEQLAGMVPTRGRDALLLDYAFDSSEAVASRAGEALFACDTLARREAVLGDAWNLLRAPVAAVREGAREFVGMTVRLLASSMKRGRTPGAGFDVFVEQGLRGGEAESGWILELLDVTGMSGVCVSSIVGVLGRGEARVVSRGLSLLRGLAARGELGVDDRLLARVRGLLEHADDRVRADALELMGVLLPESGIEKRYFEDGSARVRGNAIAASLLRDAAERERGSKNDGGETPALACLRGMLSDRRSGHRLSGCWVVGQLGSRGVTVADELAELAQDPDVAVRAAAIRAAGEMMSGRKGVA